MSGKSTETTNTQQSSRTEPWAPAQPALGGILGALGSKLGELGPSAAENQALGMMTANAQTAGQFAPQIASVAAQLLGGGADHAPVASTAYEQLQRGLLPYATGQFADPSNDPYFQRVMDDAARRASNQVNSSWAGWGRDASAGNARALAEGIASATAPLALDWYNKQQANQLGALNSLYSAGAQTAGLLSNLDATRFGTQMQGINAANSAVAAQNGPATALLAARHFPRHAQAAGGDRRADRRSRQSVEFPGHVQHREDQRPGAQHHRWSKGRHRLLQDVQMSGGPTETGAASPRDPTGLRRARSPARGRLQRTQP
jgi:hypothetical protein